MCFIVVDRFVISKYCLRVILNISETYEHPTSPEISIYPMVNESCQYQWYQTLAGTLHLRDADLVPMIPDRIFSSARVGWLEKRYSYLSNPLPCNWVCNWVSGVTSPLTQKDFWQKAHNRMLGHDWLMLKHKPITTKHSTESFFC